MAAMPTSPLVKRAGFAAARLAPGVVAAALGVYAYRVLLVAQPPFHADEAGHALPAARMALALGRGDVDALLELTRRDVLWPFFHPLFIAVFLAAFGATANVARASSLCALVATVGLVPLLVRELARPPIDDGTGDGEPAPAASPVVGWLSAAALLAAPSLWTLGCQAMTEALGMAMVVLTLLCSARAERGRSLLLHAASGVLGAFTFFTKYNYGIPLLLASFAALAWRARVRGPRPLAAFGAGAVPLLVGWFAFVFGTDRGRLEYVWSYLRVNRDEGIHGLDGLLFYPRSLVEILGLAVAIGLLLGLPAAFRRRAAGARLPSLLYASLTLLLLLAHVNKQWRYLAPAIPVLLAVAEAELAAWCAGLRLRGPAWALAAAALLVARDPLAAIRQAADEVKPYAEAGAMVRFAALHLPPDRPVLVLGSSGLLPHSALSWQLLERDRRESEVDIMLFPFEEGWDARYRSAYPTDLRPEYATTLAAALDRGSPSVVAFELGGRSPFLPGWMARWDAWAQNYVTVMKRQAGYAVAAESAFPDSDAVVRVYVPRPPVP